LDDLRDRSGKWGEKNLLLADFWFLGAARGGAISRNSQFTVDPPIEYSGLSR